MTYKIDSENIIHPLTGNTTFEPSHDVQIQIIFVFVRVKTMIEPRFMKLQIYIYFEIESLIHTKVK